MWYAGISAVKPLPIWGYMFCIASSGCQSPGCAALRVNLFALCCQCGILHWRDFYRTLEVVHRDYADKVWEEQRNSWRSRFRQFPYRPASLCAYMLGPNLDDCERTVTLHRPRHIGSPLRHLDELTGPMATSPA